ncbi:MAG: hypothetical protein U0794_13415 [Isosphaeraceae bacterium]
MRPALEALEPRQLLAFDPFKVQAAGLAMPALVRASNLPPFKESWPAFVAEAMVDDIPPVPGVFQAGPAGPMHLETYPIELPEANETRLAESNFEWQPGFDAPEPMMGMPFVALPADGHVRIIDTLDPVEYQRLYRIPLDSRTLTVAIKIQPMDASGIIAEGVTIYDGQGKTLTSFVPPQGCRSLVLNFGVRGLDRLRAGGAIFLHLTMPPSPASSEPPVSQSPTDGEIGLPSDTWGDQSSIGYVLTVQRTTLSGSSDTADGFDFGSGGWGSTGLRAESIGTMTSVVSGISLAPSAGPALLTLTSRIADRPTQSGGSLGTGPLPSLAAGPLGGTLAPDGEEPTVADRPHPEAVDTVLLDEFSTRPSIPGDPEGGHPIPEVLDGPFVPDEAIASIRGPGGVPLFGATLQSEKLDEPDFLPPELPVALAVRADDLNLALRRREDSTSIDEPERSDASRVSVFAGLTFALALSIRLTRPDLTDPVRRAGRWASARGLSLTWRRSRSGPIS